MNDNEVKVSIITVCFNSMLTIDRTIQSVLEQTYSNVEYLIIDGESTDSTVEIAQGYQILFEEKGYGYTIISEPDHGIYDAMNKGIKLATGNIIGLINSDDWYERDAVQSMIDVFLENPFDVFYADLKIHKGKKNIIKKARIRSLATTRDWNHPTTFITKSTYDEFRYQCKTLYDDWDLILRLRNTNKKIVVLNKVLANFNFGGISNQKSIKKALKRCLIRYQIYRRNGYSRLYLLDCVLIELGKLLVA